MGRKFNLWFCDHHSFSTLERDLRSLLGRERSRSLDVVPDTPVNKSSRVVLFPEIDPEDEARLVEGSRARVPGADDGRTSCRIARPEGPGLKGKEGLGEAALVREELKSSPGEDFLLQEPSLFGSCCVFGVKVNGRPQRLTSLHLLSTWGTLRHAAPRAASPRLPALHVRLGLRE